MQEPNSRTSQRNGLRHESSVIGKLNRAKLSMLIIVLIATAVQAQNAFIRVNQAGYVTTANKRAYLMASASETGATFSLKNSSGTTVYSAPIGLNLGSWSGSYLRVGYP